MMTTFYILKCLGGSANKKEEKEKETVSRSDTASSGSSLYSSARSSAQDLEKMAENAESCELGLTQDLPKKHQSNPTSEDWQFFYNVEVWHDRCLKFLKP
jgi:16S rRNA C1402 (ribose-2'-O) methylase RsmI